MSIIFNLMIQVGSQENKVFKVIAHRGLCNIFPQNTIQAVQAGLFVADLVEIDIMLTKDKKVIVMHDLGLSRLTNISEFQEWKNRKRVAKYNGKQQENWWVQDFTLEELKKLEVRQPNQLRPKLKGHTFRISTFSQILIRCMQVKANPKHLLRDAGLLVELKGRSKVVEQVSDTQISQGFIQNLFSNGLQTQAKRKQRNLPIIAQSFQTDCLLYIQKNLSQSFDIPIVVLIRKKQSSKVPLSRLTQVTLKNQIAFGVTQYHLNQKDESYIEGLIQSCQKRNIQVFYWTIADDNFQGKTEFPFGLKKYADIYLHLKKIGVTGFITQFPEKCRAFINNQFGY